MLQRGAARQQLRAAPSLCRYVRQRAGLTQEEIAEVLGIDRSAVSRYESGQRTPTGPLLDEYASLLRRLEGEK